MIHNLLVWSVAAIFLGIHGWLCWFITTLWYIGLSSHRSGCRTSHWKIYKRGRPNFSQLSQKIRMLKCFYSSVMACWSFWSLLCFFWFWIWVVWCAHGTFPVLFGSPIFLLDFLGIKSNGGLPFVSICKLAPWVFHHIAARLIANHPTIP